MRKIVHLLQSVVLLGVTAASVHAQPVAFAAERENWLRKAADNMPKLTETVKKTAMPRPQRKGSGCLPGLEDGRDRRHGNAVQPIVQGAERGDRRFRGTSYRLLLVHDRQTEHRRRRSVAVPPDVRRGARRTEYPIRSLSGRSEPRMAARRSGHRDARAGDGHAAPPYGLPLCKDRDAGPFVVRFRHYRHAVYRRNVGERHAEELAPTTDPIIAQINRTGLITLKECMQTVYEDGPKRDQRLWIGDLYLESLANTYSFKNHELTRRCLYLLAALADEDGWLHATVFEYPDPHPQTGQHCMDYSLLYGVTLYEYLKATGDRETAEDLWPVVVRQIEFARTYLKDDIYDMDKKPQWWLVFDWKEDLNRHAPMQGLMTFAIDRSYELARMLGREQEVAEWPGVVKSHAEGFAEKLLRFEKRSRRIRPGQAGFLPIAGMDDSFGHAVPKESVRRSKPHLPIRQAAIRALPTPTTI